MRFFELSSANNLLWHIVILFSDSDSSYIKVCSKLYCVCGGNKNPDVTQRSQETIIQQFIFIFNLRRAKLGSSFLFSSSEHDIA